jgi:osmoprotectant transport system permease protein
MQEHVHLWRLLALSAALPVLAMAASGLLGSLSLVKEFSGNEQRFFAETGRHVALSLGSVAIGACIAIPLGIAAARSRRAERPIFLISSTVETIPSLALFGLIIAPLSALSHAYPVLREIGIRGVGATPALIALVLYSLLPIVHNTYAGLRQVSPAALDAGLGMGMNRRQLSWKVEYPLALPLIGEGVRTATVQSIGNTAVAALIGAGGLGHFIFQGLGQAAPDLILLGALPVIALALTADLLMRGLIRILTPRGLRLEAGQ